MITGDDMDFLAESKITKVFPYLIVLCVLAALINIVYQNDITAGGVFVAICEPFVAVFILLGVYCFINIRGSVVKNRIPIFMYAVGPLIVAAAAYILGLTIIPEAFGSQLFDNTGNPLKDILVIAARLYALLIIIVLAVYGVLTVVSAYFRKYIARLYRYIGRLKNDGSDDKKGRFVLKFYGVPDIIDIAGVEMEPVERDRRFPMDDFVNMAVSIFALGIVICSYIFLNPLFINIMSIYETMLVGMMISIFIPALVAPWFITKETGAKVKSQARDLYLWKGLKNRLYQSFFAFTMILLLVVLSLYMGSDFHRILYTYIGYVAFMVFLSVIYAFTFFNRYNEDLKEGIVKSFNE